MVVFPTGSMSGDVMPLSFGIVDDSALEGSHNLSIGITGVESPNGPEDLLTVDSPESTEVLLRDNDRKSEGTITFYCLIVCLFLMIGSCIHSLF